MKKTYHGSCHCKAVTFEAAMDLAQGTGKCNCTICWKQRNWSARAEPAEFRVLTGADMLTDYGKTGDWGEIHHRFCRRCGITTHGHGHIRELGGPFVSVRLAALDDLPVTQLIAAPVRYQDGLHDNWQNPPEEIRHL